MTQQAVVTASEPVSPLVLRNGRHSEVDAIWQLLLETRFLYPEKLAAMQVGAVRETLARLLAVPSDVFKVLLAVRGDQLEGHLSCLRTHAGTWLCQHLAARPTGKSTLTTGRMLSVAILDQLLSQPDVEFVRIRYRPENAWPAREFGGCARKLAGNPAALFRTYGYAVSPTSAAVEPAASRRLTLRAPTPSDHARVAAYFAGSDQALYLRSDDLGAGEQELPHMQAAYERLGLRRRRELIVAERAGGFAGFALLELSSPGLSFSEFTNCFRVFAASGDVETEAALARAARERYLALGYARCIALVDGEQLGAFQAAGFTLAKRYACLTLHRSVVPELRAHLLRGRMQETRP